VVAATTNGKRTTYRVTTSRDGRWWLLRVPQLDIVTQARRLSGADATSRDLIALWLRIERDAFDLEIAPAVGDEGLDRLISETAQARASAARASSRASALTDQAVDRLVAKGIPLRDVGEMLGISHQRVAQLAGRSGPVVP
jgi:hypothetical protein